MKLLFITRHNPFTLDLGTPIFVRNLAKHLHNLGHDIEIVYGTTGSREHVPTFKPFGINCHAIKVSRIPYFRAMEFYHKGTLLINKILSQKDFDALVGFGAGVFFGRMVKGVENWKRKSSLIYYAIDSMTAEYERSKPALLKRGVTQRLKAWIWYRALIGSDRLSCDIANRVIASCKDTKNRIVKDYDVLPEKVKVVYFGLPDNYAEGLEINGSEIPIFLHISTSPERKGTLYFLQALKILQDKYNLRLKGVIAGSKETFYVRLARKLDVDVAFLGRIPNSELKQYYASCTALICPSLSEGFCLPVVEAAMFGKPAVVSGVGSLPELVSEGQNGFVVPVGDVLMLSERMYKLAVDNQLRKRLSEESKKNSQKFNISSTTETLVAALVNED